MKSANPPSPADQTLASITQEGCVAVVRIRDADRVLTVIEALLKGGVRCAEVTMTVPGAAQQIKKAADTFGSDIILGAGSVVDPKQVTEVVDAGARYVVSPVTVPTVIEACKWHGIPAMPGAFTPTEIFEASRLGASIVKIFPADAVGPKYLKAVLAPMPWLRLMPTGGVTPDNAGEWLHAGAAALGLGSALVSDSLVSEGNYTELERRARTLTANIKKAREEQGGRS